MIALVERLPLELWLEIISYAVSVPRPEHSFLPPSQDMSLVDGLFSSCNLLEKITNAFFPTQVRLRDADGLLGVPDEACGRIEVMKITNPLRPTLQVIERAKLFTRLEHLFVVPYYSFRAGDKTVLWFWTQERSHEVLHSLPALKYLDFKVPSIVNLESLEFRNLVELRLGQFQGEHITQLCQDFFPLHKNFIDVDEFATFLAAKLSALQLLQYLSLQVALDDYIVFATIEASHLSSPGPLHPPNADGSRRHYSECRQCTIHYNHDIIVHRENCASTIIAHALSSLNRISWTNAWRNGWFDEQGQRASRIIREKAGSLRIEREDGFVVEETDS